MNRYENGKIYKLVNDVDNEIYVGSTCLPLAKRLHIHRNKSYERTSTLVYQHMNRIGRKNIKIILVEMFSCVNKLELEKRERYWIDQLQPALNKNKPLTPEEKENYRQKYKQTDKYKAWKKAYDQTEKGKAARLRERNNKKLKNRLNQMEAIVKQYQSVPPIEVKIFTL
jgi:group I intron endonuclease